MDLLQVYAEGVFRECDGENLTAKQLRQILVEAVVESGLKIPETNSSPLSNEPPAVFLALPGFLFFVHARPEECCAAAHFVAYSSEKNLGEEAQRLESMAMLVGNKLGSQTREIGSRRTRLVIAFRPPS